MHDALDVVQLKQDTETLNHANRRGWKILTAVIIFMLCSCSSLFVFSAFQRPSDEDSRCAEEPYCALSIQICNVMPLVFLIGAGVILFRNWQKQRSLTAKYPLPKLNLNLPTKVRNHFFAPANVVGYGWIVVWLLMVVLFPETGLLSFLMIVLVIPVIQLIYSYVRNPFRGCDYAEALKRTKFLRQRLGFEGDITILSYEAFTLMHAGRAEESEKLYLQIIAQVQRIKFSDAIALNNYGCELTFQGRYEEAIPIFETAIIKQPTLGSIYDSMAMLYLESGNNPERALELAEIAVSYTKKGEARPILLANLARALAITGRSSRAETTLEEALKKPNKRNKLRMSEIHYSAGHTMQALGNSELAREHFTKATQLNPHGRVGQMAQQALSDIS